MKSIIDEFKGRIKFDNLSCILEVLKENNKLDVLSIYLGDVNGIYNVAVGNDDSYLYDLFFTDGIDSGFSVIPSSDTGYGHYIYDARYVMVLTIDKCDGIDNAEYVKADLFFDKTAIYDFIRFMDVNKCKYFSSTDISNLLKNYVPDSSDKKLFVYPSSDLIEKNREEKKKSFLRIR